MPTLPDKGSNGAIYRTSVYAPAYLSEKHSHYLTRPEKVYTMVVCKLHVYA
jgi:hypothetical protein